MRAEIESGEYAKGFGSDRGLSGKGRIARSAFRVCTIAVSFIPPQNAASRRSPVLGERLSLSPNSFALLAQLSLLETLVDEPDDLVPQPLILAQLGRVLFADDLVLGEGVLEVKGDQSLSGEVSDYTGGFGVEMCWISGDSSCASSRRRQGLLVTGLLSGLETLSSTLRVSCTDLVLRMRNQKHDNERFQLQPMSIRCRSICDYSSHMTSSKHGLDGDFGLFGTSLDGECG